MADRFQFTKKAIEQLAVPAGADRLQVYDAKVPALSLCVRGNSKTFYIYRRFRGRPQRIQLGRFPELTIDNARDKAEEIIGDYARGVDPHEHKRKARESWTLEELFAHFLETWAKPHKKRWADDVETFERYFGKAGAEKMPSFPGWRTRKISSISDDDVSALHAKLGTKHGPYLANRVLALLSKMFSHAKLRNPCEGVTRFKETERERFLLPDEMPRFIKAVKDEANPDVRDFVLLLLFTGARRNNVESMRWEELNLDAGIWTIPGSKVKGAKPMTIHLSAAALEVIDGREGNGSEWVFPSKRSKRGYLCWAEHAWYALLERAKIKDLRMHDLRRTLGSWQAAAGIGLPIIGRSLGHRTARATSIYARVDLSPVRQAVDLATTAMLTAAGEMPKALPGTTTNTQEPAKAGGR